MELIRALIQIPIIYIINALVMYVLAWYLTEIRPLPIKVKPFNCRGCMSFWLTAISGTAIALAIGKPWLIFIAILTGLINYFYIKSKFKIYE